ncbi:MAG: 3-isopropylmalate dehydratase large subunit [Alphaproteobacteria bacterium]|nr:3-isopropylmalate dehydratase large subunit [Alphaproteobacteria bacterium]
MTLSRTLTHKLLDAAATGETVAGSAWREIHPDLVLGHDATIALIVDRIARAGGRIAEPERLFLVADHFAPPSTVDRANILRRFLDFVEQSGIVEAGGRLEMMQGICHQVLVESPRCRPGSVIVGADSHTTMAGAVGAFATGMGSTDILAVLRTGRTWLSVPDSIRVDIAGDMPAWLRGKDVALHLLGRMGEAGARGAALELSGAGVPMDGRLTLCNMAVELGAKNGVWVSDAVTRDWCRARGEGGWPDDVALEDLQPDAGAAYVATERVDLSTLAPQVAAPWSPANVHDITAVAGERVHQVFIGSCAGGRLEELGDAAGLLRGRRIPPLMKLVVTPSSTAVYKEALRRGWIEDLIDAGAVVTNASCGACGGIDKGLVAAGEVCLSTSNRNFRGRMGDPDARVFLGSGLVAAATALTGRLTDPREVL